jgi:hypothetical protein
VKNSEASFRRKVEGLRYTESDQKWSDEKQASKLDDIPKPGNKTQTKGEHKVISGGSKEKVRK